MMERGKFTREEIFSQPDAWAQAIEFLKINAKDLQDFYLADEYQQVIFTGCGSTYYLSCAAAVIFQEMTGRSARAFPASELWLSPRASYIPEKRTLLVAISRSGETSETLQACEAFRADQRGKIISLVCNQGSPLTKLGDLNLVLPFAMEQSVAQTKAFSTLLLGAAGLCALWSKRRFNFDEIISLPTTGSQIINNFYPVAVDYGNALEFDRIYFLGSGARFGLGCELSLKMKEMSITHSEAFHFMEFRHGPKAMVNQNALIIGLISEGNRPHEQAVLADIGNLGGSTLTIGEIDTDISFNSGIEEVFRNILFLPFGQMLAYERSIAKGCDPDHPTHLEAVVKLNEL